MAPNSQNSLISAGAASVFAAGAACLSLTASASEAIPSPGLSVSGMLQTFFGLALILGLFVGAAWLLKRMNGGKGLLGTTGPMRVVGGMAVGTRERIVLVEIEDTWLVIGIAPGQMRTLHTLPKGSLPETAPGSDGQFGQWLRQFKDKRDETGH